MNQVKSFLTVACTSVGTHAHSHTELMPLHGCKGETKVGGASQHPPRSESP